jgi:hypothetical protein
MRTGMKIGKWLNAGAVLLLCATVRTAPLSAQAADTAGVRRAVLDYVEGFYEGDTTKLARSVSRSVYKYGYARRPDGYQGMQMPYANFIAFAEGVKQGRNVPPPNAPKRIELYDVLDQTASAKLTAWWGSDYLLLARENGRWLITHVLWQSPAPGR